MTRHEEFRDHAAKYAASLPDAGDRAEALYQATEAFADAADSATIPTRGEQESLTVVRQAAWDHTKRSRNEKDVSTINTMDPANADVIERARKYPSSPTR